MTPPRPISYSMVYKYIKLGYTIKQIAKITKKPYTTIHYYFSSMKKEGLIEHIEFGVWEINPKKSLRNYTHHPMLRSPKSDIKKEVRGHAFIFKLEVPKIKNWDKRELFLIRNKIQYTNIQKLQQLELGYFKVWLCTNSLVFYLKRKNSVFEFSSKKAKSKILLEFLKVIYYIENKLNVNFKINGNYKFFIRRQHFSLIENELAKIYNKQKKTLFVSDHKGIWLIIDNSFNLHEFETIDKNLADKDNAHFQRIFNEMRDINEYSPKIVWAFINKFITYAISIEQHIGAIKELGSKVNELSIVIDKLPKEPKTPHLKRKYGLTEEEMDIIRKW